MPFTVTMPKLSPTMEEGTIAKWHKKEGDKVESGELLIEVATDKATVEYNALDEGFLRKVLIQEGQNAKVNDPIAVFSETKEESIEGFVTQKTPPEKEDTPSQKKEGAQEEPKAQEPKPVSVPQEMPAFVPEPPLKTYEFRFPTGNLEDRVLASPLAKKQAKEKGIDLTTVKGTGPNGRITSRDLELAQTGGVATFKKREKPTITPGTYEEVALTPMRKIIAQRLYQAKSYIPHIYVRQEIDADPLFRAREELKTGGIKASFNDFVLRASALALKEHPHINSGFNSKTQSIVLFKTIDISMAVSVEGGLITPIIRHADYKNVGELGVESKELALKARQGKLKPEEFKGGSFTISNMGMFGITDFCAIINPPQSCIMSVGGIEECPVVRKGKVVVGKRMNLILSADHRVVDGAEAAKFLKSIQKLLENPSLLLI